MTRSHHTIGGRCTRGNTLSPPLLMAARLGIFSCTGKGHASAPRLWARSPGKIQLTHHGFYARMSFRWGGKGSQPTWRPPFPPFLIWPLRAHLYLRVEVYATATKASQQTS